MSTQDPINEMIRAMDRDPELAAMLRARILGDDFTQTTEQVQSEQQAISELLEKFADLSGTMVSVVTAVHNRQSDADDAISRLQQAQEAVQSEIANMRTNIQRMEADQSRIEEALTRLQSDVSEIKVDVATLKSDMEHVKGRLDGIDERMDRMDERFDRIDERFDRMDERFDRMDERFDRMDGRLDNALGANYEFKVQQNLGSIAGQNLRLRRTRTLKGPRTEDDQGLRHRVDDAEDRELITEYENHDMWLLDLIFSGQRRDSGEEVLVAAEISITAGAHDISRAKARAETLHKATGAETIPVVIAANIDQERYRAAEQAGVVVITAPET